MQDRDYPNTWISIAKQMEGIKEGHNPKPVRSTVGCRNPGINMEHIVPQLFRSWMDGLPLAL